MLSPLSKPTQLFVSCIDGIEIYWCPRPRLTGGLRVRIGICGTDPWLPIQPAPEMRDHFRNRVNHCLQRIDVCGQSPHLISAVILARSSGLRGGQSLTRSSMYFAKSGFV
ncbi:hypothetical protein ABM90_14205 [Rhodococcus erythropolis]|nr:hypothetical protein ABM90_14205 [Rhodococcus erythropolis]